MQAILPHLPGMLLGIGVIILGIFSPGPAVLALIGLSLERGRPAGIALASGIITGSAFWGLCAAAGMATLLATYAQAVIVLKIIGGLYLLWLAYKSFRAAARPDHMQALTLKTKGRSARHYWLAGLMIHLTNPKAIFAWLTAITVGTSPSSPLWVGFVIVAGGVLISILGNMSYALLFSTQKMGHFYRRARRAIQATFGAIFALAGLKLITSR